MNLGESSVSDSTPLVQSGSGGSTPTLSHLVEKVKMGLSPDLLKKRYREQNVGNPMFGHCYIATEALFYLLNDKRYVPTRGRDDAGIVHWWLTDKHTGQILDPTADQYRSKGLEPPYSKGKGGGFLTKEPSQRCVQLLKKIR